MIEMASLSASSVSVSPVTSMMLAAGTAEEMHRDACAVHLLADGVGGAGLDVHQRADVAVLEDGNIHHRVGVDAVGGKLDLVLADLLLLGLAILADPVGLDGRLLLVDRPFALGQRVLGEQQRGDLLALDLLLDGRGDGGGQGPHAFGRLERLAHQPRHGLHVFLGVDVHLFGFHVRWAPWVRRAGGT